MIDLMPGVVGWVIGKGGQRIKEMMAASQCRMWVDQDVPADEPRKLHLMVRGHNQGANSIFSTHGPGQT